jgi:hypothetical protein
MAQVVEYLPRMWKTLSSNSSITKNKRTPKVKHQKSKNPINTWANEQIVLKIRITNGQ